MPESLTEVIAEGVLLRPGHRDDAEFAALAEVHRRSAEHDGLDPHLVLEPPPDAEALRARSEGLADPVGDQRVVEAAGLVIGQVDVLRWTEDDGTRVVLHRGCLAPEYRGRGIGSAMVEWAERRAWIILAAVPRDPQLPMGPDLLGANAPRGARASTELLRGLGYTPRLRLGEFQLADGAPRSALPPAPEGMVLGFAIGPAEYAEMWQLNELAYRGRPGKSAGTAAGRARFVEASASMVCLTAWNSGQLAGFLRASVEDDATGRSTARILDLTVRPGLRRRGIGRVLLLCGLDALRGRRPQAVRLWTNLENPQHSYELYAEAGFELREEFVRYARPAVSARRSADRGAGFAEDVAAAPGAEGFEGFVE
jgi:ribosomal protein S18 acetylase RimI-like enzyme